MKNLKKPSESFYNFLRSGISFVKPQVKIQKAIHNDLRIEHFLGRDFNQQTKPNIVILGFPSDEGVIRNDGRGGASLAPDSIRQAFYQLTPDSKRLVSFSKILQRILDLGNLKLSKNMEENQELLGKLVASCLLQNILPIILGGGHETSYGHFLGYVKNGQDVSILNWDAHADVRELRNEKGHSGSPFRQAVLHPAKKCRQYSVAGLLPYSVSKDHLTFISKHHGKYYWKNSLAKSTIQKIYRLNGRRLVSQMVSFDVDAVDQSDAPGVSAPAVNGMSNDLWLYAAYLAGRSSRVSSFDLVETNPRFDRDGQTAKLAAVTIWHFLKGFSERTFLKSAK